MKTIFRLIVVFAAALVALIAIIKYTKGCSWKDAVGILEELCKEFKEACPCSCDTEPDA